MSKKPTILTIDIGNTSTVFGLFEDGDITAGWRFATKAFKQVATQKIAKWFDLPRGISKVVISSVVPYADKPVDKLIKALKITSRPVFVSAKDLKGIKICLECSEVGADRVVNAFAVKKLYGYPAIIIDFGTATTFCTLNAKGDYLGGAIAPGIQVSVESLHEKTAKLPLIKLERPAKNVIGGSTQEAMESGLYLGYVSMVEGMVVRLKKALSGGAKKIERQIKVIATGGYAPLIWQGTKVIDIIDSDLTLKGLYLIGVNK